MKHARILLIVLLLLEGLAQVPPSTAQSCAYGLGTEYNFRSAPYGSYVFWNQTIYFNSSSYDVGPDGHVYFVSASLGSCGGPTQTFGVVSQGGNATIAQIGSSGVVINEATGNGQIENLTFYYPSQVPTEVVVGTSGIPESSYFTSHSSWAASAAPSVFWNQTARSLTVEAVDSPAVDFRLPAIVTTTTTPTSETTRVSSTTTETSSGISAEEADYIAVGVVVVIIAVLVLLIISAERRRGSKA